MKQLKLWMFLICFALGLDSSEGKKCCVSRAYAVCWVTPNFWEKKHLEFFFTLFWISCHVGDAFERTFPGAPHFNEGLFRVATLASPFPQFVSLWVPTYTLIFWWGSWQTPEIGLCSLWTVHCITLMQFAMKWPSPA